MKKADEPLATALAQSPGLCDLTLVTSTPFAWTTAAGKKSSGQLLFRRYVPKNGAAEFGIFVLRESGSLRERTALHAIRSILLSWNTEIEKQKLAAPALYLEDERSASGYFVAAQDQRGDIAWREETGGLATHLKEQFTSVSAGKSCH